MSSVATEGVSDVPLREGELAAMQLALQEARAAGEAGEVPVGAVVLLNGQKRMSARNRMRADNDSTSHAEVIVLREIEGLSYKEIAAVVGVPIGTVMSRLARGRERLQTVLKLSSHRETLR